MAITTTEDLLDSSIGCGRSLGHPLLRGSVELWGNSRCPPCGLLSMEALISIGRRVECEMRSTKCHGSSNADMQ